MTLHRMPNGVWINPLDITRIHVFDDQYSNRCGVTVIYDSKHDIFRFDNLTDAQNYADKLGALANAEKKQ